MSAQTLGFWAAVSAVNLLVVFHGLLIPWRKNAEGIGIHLFVFHVVIALVLNHVVIQSVFPDYPGRQHIRLVLNWAVAGILWWRLIIMMRAQLKGTLRKRGKARDERAANR